MENNIYNVDCMKFMSTMKDRSVDFVLTDIPYGHVTRPSNGLQNLDYGDADIETFDLIDFCKEVYRITNNSVCIFCGKEQLSTIFSYFAKQKGTTRCVVWKKTNPSPMNGQYVYLSDIELAVWFKKRGGGTFNAHCKGTVFQYPLGKRGVCPTMKNIKLFKELILDNTNENDLVFDPCMGSGTTAVACMELGRRYLGCELNEEYYKSCCERISKASSVLVK